MKTAFPRYFFTLYLKDNIFLLILCRVALGAMTPEEKARIDIDKLLTFAGWQVQDREHADLGTAPGVAVREVTMKAGHGEADDVLFVNKKAIGTVEAKPADLISSFRTSCNPSIAVTMDMNATGIGGIVGGAGGVNNWQPGRNSLRLHGYDYSQSGAYFIASCVKYRLCIFGEILDGEMKRNECGAIVRDVWNDLPNHYPQVVHDEFIVIPNHIHGIIKLTGGSNGTVRPGQRPDDNENVGGHDVPVSSGVVAVGLRPDETGNILTNNDPESSGCRSVPITALTTTTPHRHDLHEIVRALKSFTARRINELNGTTVSPTGQRPYQDHIIRNEEKLMRIRTIIRNNPMKGNEVGSVI